MRSHLWATFSKTSFGSTVWTGPSRDLSAKARPDCNMFSNHDELNSKACPWKNEETKMAHDRERESSACFPLFTIVYQCDFALSHKGR